MNAKWLLHAVAAPLVCLGCTSLTAADTDARAKLFAQAYAGQLCADPRKCTVTVKVGENCSFTVTPFTIGVPVGNQNVKLHWVIDPASAGSPKFTTNGIVFKSPTKEFDQGGKVSDTEFKFNDKNDGATPKPRFHAYSINVTQGKATCTADPTVVNDF